MFKIKLNTAMRELSEREILNEHDAKILWDYVRAQLPGHIETKDREMLFKTLHAYIPAFQFVHKGGWAVIRVMRGCVPLSMGFGEGLPPCGDEETVKRTIKPLRTFG